MASYFIGTRLLGRGVIPHHVYTPDQTCLFCETCGEIWGRVVVSTGGRWDCAIVPCIRHRPNSVCDWGKVPGSFVQSRVDHTWIGAGAWPLCLDLIPDGVLAWEFEAHLRWAERTEE